jgi:hemerythrin-like domain-containing protein
MVMRTVETLMHEHRVVEQGLGVLEAMAARLARGQSVPPDHATELLDFFRDFVDGCHHAKEEQSFFPALVERGIPREGGPVGVMLSEHDQGRSLQRQMREALPRLASDAGARSRFAQAVGDYATLLRQHIMKEDNVLFKMAERVLSPEDDRRLAEAFDRHERETMGAGTHERFHSLIDRLAAEYRPG